MERRIFTITTRQAKRLEAAKAETGLTMSEIVRRALDEYAENEKTKIGKEINEET